MKQFACKDLGMDCDFVATGNTVDEVKKKVMEHAQARHADTLKKMTATPEQKAEFEKTVVSKIR
jgi:predicted small metal-binding protein